MDIDVDIDIGEQVAEAVSLAPEEAFTLFLDTAAMHRNEARGRGFSPEAAEQMAVALHSGLVALYFMSADQ